MNLSELQFHPKLRSQWQAIDLGILIARRWYKPLLLSWMLPALGVLIICHVFFYRDPSVSLLIIWWLKPLFDRLPLILLSRYIFNESPSKTLSRSAMVKLCLFDLISALTWRRFEFKRSFNLAVSMLEQQKGKSRRKRCNLLQFGSGNAAGWLTITLVHIELLLCISTIALVAMFIPNQLDLKIFESFFDNPLVYEHLFIALYFTCFCAVAPFYIASGFSLYLNRRIELEAWDLELTFRDSMERRKQRSFSAGPHANQSKSKMLVLLIILCSSLFYLPPNSAVADELTQENAAQSKETIQTILESPPFVIEKNISSWEFKESEHKPEQQDNTDFRGLLDSLKWLKNFITDAALLFEVIIWGLIAYIVFIVAKSILNTVSFTQLSTKGQTISQSPEVIMGMAITKESLPDDISAAIQKHLNERDFREALSLLYRYSLFSLVNQHQIPLEDHHTEKECSNLVEKLTPSHVSELFTELTLVWQYHAYAHQSIGATEIENLLKRTLEALGDE